MKIVGIETATWVCGVGYLDSDGISHIVEDKKPREHARLLPVFFKEVKEKMECELSELDGIAVSIGPGSFTGLRIGLSYAKGLAYSHDLPIIPVPTLEAMASQVVCDTQFNLLVYSHRDMIYHQSFLSDNSPENNATVSSWGDLAKEIVNAPIYHFNCHKFFDISENVYEISASVDNTCSLGLKHFNDWVIKDPFMMVPNYIAPFEMSSSK